MLEFTAVDGQQYPSAVEYLAQIALSEKWHFGPTPENPSRPYPILENYLRYTFTKVENDGQIAYGADERDREFATFNTGLVDKLYDPIFMLVRQNHRRGAQRWAFDDFCSPGKGRSGKNLTSIFDPLPDPPRYFQSNFDMLLDTSRDIYVDYEHVVLDAIQRDRLPADLLSIYVPAGFEWKEYAGLEEGERRVYLSEFRGALEEDAQCMRGLKEKLENAIDLAWKRTKWNYKTAIPQYYPRHNNMSLLLPLALLQDDRVDVALVVTRNPSGSYQGRTVLPLDWAYQNARLVCRPDSDWLDPSDVFSTRGEEVENEEDSDEAEHDDDTVPDTGTAPLPPPGDLSDPPDDVANELDAYTVGDVVTGVVEGLKPFGAFIELPDGLRGLLHVSEIASEFVADPAEYLSIGESVTVRVTEVDRSRTRISFSRLGID